MLMKALRARPGSLPHRQLSRDDALTALRERSGHRRLTRDASEAARIGRILLMSALTVDDDTVVDPALTRVRVDLAYDGASYHGWARQPGLPSVQEALEDGLEKIIRRRVRTIVAGRTDAGVHAAHQVVHFDLTEEEWFSITRGRVGLAPESSLVRRLNGVLQAEQGAILVRAAQRAPRGFDARFSALSRQYRYMISDRLSTRDPLRRVFTHWHGTTLDADLMNSEAQSVLGLHDYLSFCKPREGATTIRTLQDFDVVRERDETITAYLQADAFCHNMVRALVGSSMLVGEGKREPGWLARRMRKQERGSDVRLAPAHGLVLEHVEYPGDDEMSHRAERTRAKRQSGSSSRF